MTKIDALINRLRIATDGVPDSDITVCCILLIGDGEKGVIEMPEGNKDRMKKWLLKAVKWCL